MVELAAHLVDHVFPEAPVRQFVLTFPLPLRFLLAANPEALAEVLAVAQRAISTFLIRQAGFTVASGARTGAVTLIQRFDSALNLNPHLHMLFLDGTYCFRGGRATFHRAQRSRRDELVKLLHALSGRIVRLLERCGLLIADEAHPSLDMEMVSPWTSYRRLPSTTGSPSARTPGARRSPCTAYRRWRMHQARA